MGSNRGSYRQFHHPTKPGTVIIAVAGRVAGLEIPSGMLNSILKQAD